MNQNIPPSPRDAWRPEDQRSWEELERRAAAQARDFYGRAFPVPERDPDPPPPPPPKEPPPPPEPPASPPPASKPPSRKPSPGPPFKGHPPQPGPLPLPQGQRPAPHRKLLGRFSGDQLLLAALLCLLVQEEAEPQLILAVAYVLIG